RVRFGPNDRKRGVAVCRFLPMGVSQFVFLLLVVVLPHSGFGSQLADKIEAITGQPQFKHAHWGLLVVDRESGETLYEVNAEKLFAPASTTKLFSVAAALD